MWVPLYIFSMYLQQGAECYEGSTVYHLHVLTTGGRMGMPLKRIQDTKPLASRVACAAMAAPSLICSRSSSRPCVSK